MAQVSEMAIYNRTHEQHTRPTTTQLPKTPFTDGDDFEDGETHIDGQKAPECAFEGHNGFAFEEQSVKYSGIGDNAIRGTRYVPCQKLQVSELTSPVCSCEEAPHRNA